MVEKDFPSNEFEEYMIESVKVFDDRTIVYVDGEDIRLAHALKLFKEYSKCRTVMLGDRDKILGNLRDAGIVGENNIEVIEPGTSSKLDEYKSLMIKIFSEKNKELSEEAAQEMASKPNYYAALMLKSGDAHCGVSGSISSTEALMRPLIQVIGTGTPKRFLSGAVMQIVPDCPYGMNGKFIFSDVAVIPEPNEDQLTDIVLFTYKTARAFFDGEPKIAMLSYSTKGSANSEKIEIIRRVVKKVKVSNPEIKIDGELQFDAAVIPEVAKSKGGNSEVAGQANVLIFPNLDAANICIKAVNRLAKTSYYGTIIQGSPIPFNDLSRGTPAIEIVKLSFLTLMQLKEQ
jgi:phosphate acetyltransferase